ncbi:hypothetical protein [Actinomadura flavalba]|uniref:hypothetical protein n=1 Tax=Actinomadura flavalba TaxID=1120938 RepID=UPI00037E9D3A|nr:hypothetical protein [Actinomadura flavalba]
MNRNLRRAAVLTFAAAGVLATAPALAHADAGFGASAGKAGPSGAALHVRTAYADDQGKVRYRDSYYTAGPRGAKARHVHSAAR